MNKIDKKNDVGYLLFKKLYLKKIFIISGKNSFFKSGAKKFFLEKINKNDSIFYFWSDLSSICAFFRFGYYDPDSIQI